MSNSVLKTFAVRKTTCSQVLKLQCINNGQSGSLPADLFTYRVIVKMINLITVVVHID